MTDALADAHAPDDRADDASRRGCLAEALRQSGAHREALEQSESCANRVPRTEQSAGEAPSLSGTGAVQAGRRPLTATTRSV